MNRNSFMFLNQIEFMIKYLILTIALIGIGLSHLEDTATHLQQSLN